MMLLYIDPGTGSMLFAVLVSLIGAVVYGARSIWMKLKFKSGTGKNKKDNSENIPIAIFSDNKRYWNTFGPICREFEKRKQPVTFMTVSADDPALKEDFKYVKTEFIGEGNKAFAKLNFLKADVFLSTTPGLDVYQWKRSKDVKFYAHILHMASDPTLYRMFGLDYYDGILLSGEYQVNQIRELEKLRNLPPKDLVTVGVPYMDLLLEKVNKTVKEEDHKTTVLLAPSWGKSAILSKYGEKIIDALISTGYHIIVRPHPQSYSSEKELLDGLMKKYPDLEWNRDTDNFDVLSRSDIMISDFSGVIFDFALVFGKPVIYADTEFDFSPYDACWLEEETWTFRSLSKIGKQLNEDEFSDIKSIIDNCLSDKKFQDNIELLRKESWSNIGFSTKLTVDYLIEKYNNINKVN